MKRIFFLFIITNLMSASDIAQQSRDKDRYYKTAKKVMLMIQSPDEKQKQKGSPIVQRRILAAASLYVETSSELIRVSSTDNADSKWKLVEKDDFKSDNNQ